MTRTLLALVLVLFTAAAVHAQDLPKVGVTMGYPASVGVIWHVSDRVALRPELSLTEISSTSESVITACCPASNYTTQLSSDQWSVGIGASALFYVTHADALRTYVSPRFVYARGSTSSAINTPVNTTPQSIEYTQNTYFVSGSFGAQYALGARFSLYGELGLGYQHTTSESTANGAGNTKTNTVATRSGAGVILYFGR